MALREVLGVVMSLYRLPDLRGLMEAACRHRPGMDFESGVFQSQSRSL